MKKGKRMAFTTIFHIYERRVYHFVFSYTKSEFTSEEIVQEVFLQLWEKRSRLDVNKSFHSFIFTMARNRTFNYLRDASKRKSLRKELWQRTVEQYEQIEKELVFEEYMELVENIVHDLPVNKRSVYVLSKQEGKTHVEISALLGISVKTVKNHLWETTKLIKVQLRPHLENVVKLVVLLVFS